MPATEITFDEKTFLACVKEINETKTRVGNINGALGDKLSQAKEAGKLQIAAAKHVSKLIRMDELDRDQFLEHVELGIAAVDKAGLWPAHTGDLDKLARQREQEDKDAAKQDKKSLDALGKEIAKENAAKVAKEIRKLEVVEGGKPEPKKRGRPAKAKAEGAEEFRGFK